MDGKRKKVRGGHRLHAKKTCDALGALFESIESSPDSTPAAEVLIKLKSLRQTLRDKVKVLDDLSDGILEQLETDEEIEQEILETSEYKEHLQTEILKVDTFLTKKDNYSETSKSNNIVINSTETQSIACKLPKLQLKGFDGNPQNWREFWEGFEAAVHKNAGISAIDKFNYLRGLLQGTAAQAISGFSLSSENYEQAVGVLEKRFGNPQTIIASHMDSLLKIQSVKSVYETKELRNVYDLIESNIRSLKTLGIASEQYGSLLVPVMISKIPQELQLIISRQFTGEKWDFEVFLKIFREELEARERCVTVSKVGLSSTDNNKKTVNSPKPSPMTATALVSSDKKATQCTFCKNEHSSASCEVVTDLKARKAILRSEGRCFVCLRKHHLARDCTSKIKCFLCSKRHHASVCDGGISQPKPTQASTRPAQVPQARPTSNSSHTSLYLDSTSNILLQTASAVVSNPNSYGMSAKVRLILDLGSQRSYITHRLRNSLNLARVGSENLLVKTFGSSTEQFRVCEVVQVAIKGLNDDLNMYITCYTVPTICSPLGAQHIEFAKRNYHHLNGLDLADKFSTEEGVEIEMLIGADFFWHVATGRVIRGEHGPVAMETRLGYVLSGPVWNETRDSHTVVNITSTHTLKAEAVTLPPEEDSLTDQLQRFWNLESIGVLPKDCAVHEKFKESIEFRDGRYMVCLPWKEGHRQLADNYELSFRRLVHLIQRLKQDHELCQEYSDIISKQLEMGIIEEVQDNSQPEVGRVYYIPHHPVIRRDKDTTRVRIVYDASAKKIGPSLNDCLHTGPSLIPKIMDILMRFRFHKTALVADIEKAFHQVSIVPEDRDVLRFLWLEDIKADKPQLKTYRFTRAVFGVNASPFLLNATIANHIEGYTDNPDFIENILSSLYVDDLNGGASTTEEAYNLYLQARKAMAEGGFNLRKWQSNDQRLMKMIQSNEEISSNQQEVNQGLVMTEDERTFAHTICGTTEDSPEQGKQKLLGMIWNFLQDELSFDLTTYESFASALPLTKRNILRITAKIYDPLGLIAPIVLPMKVMFQQLCLGKSDWDSPLDDELKKKVSAWLAELKDVGSMSLPRCYADDISKNIKTIQLHGFGDASCKAYGAVIFIRIETRSGCHVKLVASKSRVAPVVKQSIPRLELLSALTLARLITTVKSAFEPIFKVDSVYCWLDSLTALYWIKQESKEWKPFVQNRAIEIRSLVEPQQWFHCSSEENVADIVSRGSTPRGWLKRTGGGMDQIG